MKKAKDFRKSARDALNGKWIMAILAGLIAYILYGATLNTSFSFSTSGGLTVDLDVFKNTPDEAIVGLLIIFLAILAIVTLFSIVLYLLGSIIKVGYARFNIGLIDGTEISYHQLFSEFSSAKRALIAGVLEYVYILLWTFLFIVPGIIAAYSYAMVPFILAEDPNITDSQAIARSKQMMKGNKWRLFCLRLSFIGWSALAALALGLGDLVLNPYKEAANADFYREISGTRRSLEPDPMADFNDGFTAEA